MSLASDIELDAPDLAVLRETYTGSQILDLVRERRHYGPSVRIIDLFRSEFQEACKEDDEARAAFVEFLRSDFVPDEVVNCLVSVH